MSVQTRIMYIEYKGDGLTGEARIGRVTFSKTGKSVHYHGKTFQVMGIIEEGEKAAKKERRMV